MFEHLTAPQNSGGLGRSPQRCGGGWHGVGVGGTEGRWGFPGSVSARQRGEHVVDGMAGTGARHVCVKPPNDALKNGENGEFCVVCMS